MSSVKKKVTLDKNDLRRLMKEKGSSLSCEKKVESPYAKYNALGQLWCTLCNCPVKTNLLWNAHIQGRTHKENFSTQQKTGAVNVLPKTPVVPIKRKATDNDDCNGIEKKYQKGEASCSGTSANSMLPADFFDNKLAAAVLTPTPDDTVLPNFGVQASSATENLPADSFDTTQIAPVVETALSGVVIAEKLPEGFFDDPKMDAKVRQVPFKDKMEDEWELFQKSMKEESMVSEALVEEDDELREEERNIEEIDDQLNRWSRVTNLLKKKEEISTLSNSQQKVENMSDSDTEAADFDEFLDWRSKKAWK